jgi:hypothetical protein
MKGMGPDIWTEKSEELDPKQLHFGDWMVKGVLDRATQIEVIEGGVTIVWRRSGGAKFRMISTVRGINRKLPIEIGQKSGGRVRIVSRKEVVGTVLRKEGGAMADSSQKTISGDGRDRENKQGKHPGPNGRLL